MGKYKINAMIVMIWIALFGCSQSPNSLPIATIAPSITAPFAQSTQPAATAQLSTETTIPPTPMMDFNELRIIFEYDKTMPLNENWGSEIQQGAATIHNLSFMGADQCKVHALWITPDDQGPFPVIIYMHMGDANKNQYLDEAILLTEHNVAALLLDSPFVKGCGDTNNPRVGYIRMVTDTRRGIDLLETLAEVDSARIGYVGHSFGATWGGVLAGVEPRIKAFVLIAGAGQISQLDSPEVPDLDAIHYIAHAQGAEFLFQFSTKDKFINQEDAQQYFDTASGIKEIIWYDSTHRGLQEAGQEDRLSWLAKQLGFEYP
jgi:dienelactone hydrolase